MQLFYCPGLPEGDHFLDLEESQHCAKVLRKKAGDIIDITDGKGKFYQALLEQVVPKKCHFTVVSSQNVKALDYSIHIAIAPTKNADRMEWFIEKAVETGVDKVTFIISANSERKSINLDRLHKKAVSAMKQSVRAHLPQICDLIQLHDFVKQEPGGQKFIAHMAGPDTPYLQQLASAHETCHILIGPEGGFDEAEISLATQAQYQMARLGDHRLRTETAGMVACIILNQLNQR
ncbi:MAG: 16S rRNA (uracil(1498)-N(3))-methyltransferase [Cyclobacteriaceae bacterium]|nr:16S rRNA (uracil(1498)-N(3))-methyltransferase [Cyclobacteriaceae bacterium]